MGAEGRKQLVNAARRNRRWPGGAFTAEHARKHGEGRNREQYADWAQSLKNRPGVQVFAYIHPVKKDRSLAFVDHRESAIVQFSFDRDRNMDCIYPSQGTRRYLADRPGFTRLRETEL